MPQSSGLSAGLVICAHPLATAGEAQNLRPVFGAGGVIPKHQAPALEDTLETVVNAFHLKLNQAGSRFLLCSATLL